MTLSLLCGLAVMMIKEFLELCRSKSYRYDKMKTIRSDAHQLGSYKLNKVSLSGFDDKRYIHITSGQVRLSTSLLQTNMADTGENVIRDAFWVCLRFQSLPFCIMTHRR